MNLAQTLDLLTCSLGDKRVTNETPQADNAAFVGKPFRVVDTPGWGYGQELGEYDTREEAETAALARPGAKVVTQPELKQLQENKDKHLAYSQVHNPDLDAEGTAPTSGTSLQERNDAVDTPKVRDYIRRRQVKTNPDVDGAKLGCDCARCKARRK